MLPLLAAMVLPVMAFGAGVPAPAVAGLNTPFVKVDTVGYPAAWAKKAIVTGEPWTVTVLPLDGQAPELSLDPATFSHRGKDAASGEDTWEVDFSAVSITGRYRLSVTLAEAPEVGTWLYSSPFTVEARPYDRALLAAQKMFYYQRTRTQLKEPYTLWDADDDEGGYTRKAASHTHGQVGWVLDSYPHKTRRWKTVKGWFDAGNYDMYIPSTAPSAQMLLWAWELSPGAFGDANGIPESGNGVPDILDEARWGLDWVLSLQTKSGAFRAREATMKLGVVPEGDASLDHNERWVSGIASASTAKACAVLAKAARLYKPYDRKAGEDYARGALSAWKWLRAHPQRVTFNAHDAEQPLWDDGPEYPREEGSRAAAAFEIWRSFRDKSALADLRKRWDDEQLSAGGLEGGWPNIGRFAVLGVLLDDGSPADLRAQAKERLFQAVDAYQARVGADGYRCALKPDEYYWGSPCVLMEKAALLALAARLDPEGHAWALEAARDQWHWVLGRNPNAYSLVSRFGRGPTRIYHTEWGHKRVPPPGFLVDGPNFSSAPFLSPDAPAKALLWYSPTDLASGVKAGDPWHNDQRDLWDGGFVPYNQWDTGWWVVTEVDLYYNAALVLAGALIVP
jgi:endoglucanase